MRRGRHEADQSRVAKQLDVCYILPICFDFTCSMEGTQARLLRICGSLHDYLANMFPCSLVQRHSLAVK